MMWRRRFAMAAVVACSGLWARGADAAVLCSKRSGVVTVRETTCKKKETALDVASILPPGSVGTGALADGAVSEGKLAPGAVPKVLSLNPYGAFLGSAATFSSGFGPHAGIHLPDGSNGSLGLGFRIPPNYTSGTPLTVRVLWHTGGTACQILLLGNSISVARAGRTHVLEGAVSTADGLTIVGGSTLTAPDVAEQTNETLIEITSPEPGTPLLPGDSVIFNVFRAGGFPGDTCVADMVLQSFRVEYQ